MTYPTVPQPPAAPRRSRKGLWIGLVAAAVVLLAICGGLSAVFLSAADEALPDAPAVSAPSASTDAAPAAEPTEDSKEATAKVGEALTQSGDTEATWTVTKTTQKAIAQFDQKPDNGVYLLAHVKASVTSGQEFVCGCSFQLVTKAGKVYEPTWAGFKGYEDLSGHDVAAGQTADGWVAFDVPKAALKGAKLKLALNQFTGVYGYWTL